MASDSTQNVQGMHESEIEEGGQHHRMAIIGIPIGGTIATIGLILMLYGLAGGPDLKRSLGINMDLWWGLLMLVFGLLMTGLSYLFTRRNAVQAQA